MHRNILAVFMATLLLCTYGCKAQGGRQSHIKYQITASLDVENMTLSGSLNLEYKNIADKEITDLKFNIYPNAYREGAAFYPISQPYFAAAYENGQSYGNMTIDKAYENKKEILPIICGEDENILLLNLEKSLFPNEQTQISIDFTLNLANVNHSTGYTASTINLANWYPVLCVDTNSGWYENIYYFAGDPFYSEAADYEVTLSLPKAYVAAASAPAENAQYGGENATYSYRAANLRDFAVVLSKDFNIAQRQVGGVSVEYYYIDDDEHEKTLSVAADSLQHFSSVFLEYPYPQLAVVRLPHCYFGEASSNLIMISDSLDGQSLIYQTALQTAHQWWSKIVGNNQADSGWLDGGLAAISAAMFFEQYKDYGVNSGDLVKAARAAYKEYSLQINDINGKKGAMDKQLKDYKNRFEYINITVNKSLIMLDLARLAVGGVKFNKTLASYCQKFAYKNAAPEDFIGFFEKTKLNTTEYFYSWIDGSVLI